VISGSHSTTLKARSGGQEVASSNLASPAKGILASEGHVDGNLSGAETHRSRGRRCWRPLGCRRPQCAISLTAAPTSTNRTVVWTSARSMIANFRYGAVRKSRIRQHSTALPESLMYGSCSRPLPPPATRVQERHSCSRSGFETSTSPQPPPTALPPRPRGSVHGASMPSALQPPLNGTPAPTPTTSQSSARGNLFLTPSSYDLEGLILKRAARPHLPTAPPTAGVKAERRPPVALKPARSEHPKMAVARASRGV
jgi:hypothetical protein